MDSKNVIMGKNVKVIEPVNIYGCDIGDNVFIGPFVEIQNDVIIKNNTRVSSHSFICSGVNIGKDVFVAHGVMFVNDKFDSNSIEDWEMKKTVIGDNVRIGSNATILPVNVGDNCIIGAGAVVTKDVPENSIVAGNPARVLKKRD